MPQFTVKSTMATGKADAKFGQEFYVQFNETEQAFPLWFKEAPAIGKEIEGEIINGKFKKVKKEWNPSSSSSSESASASSSASSQPSTKPVWKDNSDGMRQGMCFNNAAAYVNTLEFQAALTDREWADTVFSYAQALYRKGDLSQEVAGTQEVTLEDAPAGVQAVFAQ